MLHQCKQVLRRKSVEATAGEATSKPQRTGGGRCKLSDEVQADAMAELWLTNEPKLLRHAWAVAFVEGWLKTRSIFVSKTTIRRRIVNPILARGRPHLRRRAP
jgi:hypothetical protein